MIVWTIYIFYIDGFDEFRGGSAGMNSASAYGKVFPFLAKLMINLIPIGYDDTGEIFEKLSGVICPAGRLPVIKNDGMCDR